MFLFVSHAGEESSVAIEVVRELERRGVSCWAAARDLVSGRPSEGQIAQAIESSRAVLLILSASGNDGDDIQRVVALASDACKVVVPLRIENSRSKKGLRIRLSDLHAIDAFVSREQTIDKLVHRLQPSRAGPAPVDANVPAAQTPTTSSPSIPRNVARPADSSAAAIGSGASSITPSPPSTPRPAAMTSSSPPRASRAAPVIQPSSPIDPWPAPIARRSTPKPRRAAHKDAGPNRRALVLGSAVVAVTFGALVLGMILQSSPGTTAISAPIQVAKTVARMQDDSSQPALEASAAQTPQPERPASGWLQAVLDPSAQPAPPSSAQRDAASETTPLWLPLTWRPPADAPPVPTRAQQAEADTPPQSQLACARNPATLASVTLRPAKPLSAIEECALKPKDIFKECANCPIEVVVPTGSFTMGAAKGSKILLPEHDVTISRPFAVGQFAVTFDEWDACVNDGGCGGYRPPDEGWGRGQRPVINVSWNDAKAYVGWLSHKTGKSYRLLTEAEREYVTRAGTHTPFWWGSSVSTKQANYDGTQQAASTNTVKVEPGRYRQQTVPVNTFAANPFGLYQVHGNVLEWTEDCFHVGYAGAPTDGSAWTSTGACDDDAHIVRGGSWDEPWTFALSEFRGKGVDRSNIIGLRVARTIQAPDRSNSVLARQ